MSEQQEAVIVAALRDLDESVSRTLRTRCERLHAKLDCLLAILDRPPQSKRCEPPSPPA